MPFGIPQEPTPDFDSQSLLHRLLIFIHSLDHLMHINAVQAELIIVHWDDQEVHPSHANNRSSLLDLVPWQDLQLNMGIIRVIQVTPNMTRLAPPCLSSLFPTKKKIPAQAGSLSCFQLVAKNVGARRSQGKLLVLLNLDSLLSPRLGSLFATPEFWIEDVFYRAPRVNLKATLSLEPPAGLWGSLAEKIYGEALTQLDWEPYGGVGFASTVALQGPIVPRSLKQIIALSDINSGDFLLMSKKRFLRLGGYPEIGNVLCVCVCVILLPTHHPWILSSYSHTTHVYSHTASCVCVCVCGLTGGGG